MKRCEHKSLEKCKLKWYHYLPMRMAKIQITDNAKCWWGYRATGTLTYCWWECKVVQPLWKTVWWFLPKLNTLSPYDSAVAFPGIYPKELKNYIHIKTCTQMFTAASFIMTAHTWKQPRWTDKYTVLHPDNGILFSAKKKCWKEARKGHGGRLDASYRVTQANLKRQHTVQFRWYNILEKAKLWRQ